jgi:selenocysteine lyase/cysteine desulfurase
MAYGCAPGLASSIDYLLRLDVGRIFSRNKTLADFLIEGLRERNAEILSPSDDGARSSIVATRFTPALTCGSWPNVSTKPGSSSRHAGAS